jgi:curved DNA-binding protein CbpA
MTERRLFKRYNKNSQFILAHNGETFKAKMIDYSLDGIGLATKVKVPIQKGDVVVISCETPQFNAAGRVAWTYDMDSEKRYGIQSIGQLCGRIDDFKISDTMIGIQLSQKSGILQVERGKVIRKVYIKGGDIVFAYSNQETEHLGAILVKEKKITRGQLLDVMDEMEETKERMGRILVRRALLKPQEIWKYVGKQAEEIILNLFSLEEGMFFFDEMSSLPTEELIELKLSAANLIYYGSKRVENMNRILNEVPSLENVLGFSSDPLDLFQNLQLDKSGKEVIACLKKRTTIQGIIAETGLDKSEVLKTIYALMNARIIEAGREEEPSDGLSEEEIKEMFDEKTDPKQVEMVEEMYGKYKKLSFWEVLGVTNGSSSTDIKRAYYLAAKKFHPDNHFGLEDDDLKRKLSRIFMYIYQAYTTLSDPIRRREYEESLKLKPGSLASKKGSASKPLSEEDRARNKFKTGIKLYRNENYEEAEHAFKQALFIDGSKAEYHYYHGISLLKLARYSDAKNAIEKAIKLDPAQGKYYKGIGDIFVKKGCPTRAESYFQKASELTEDFEGSYDGESKTYHI